ncbi:MAG TPA: hypothetical protein VMD25_13160 [Acidobacteriaceae bacterium]|nr:hypothetical protein [Acidobacteriaceae bacterium]
MRPLRPRFVRSLTGLLPLLLALPAFGVACTTESQMSAGQRAILEQAARSLAANIAGGDTAAVKAQTISAVAARFSGIAESIQSVSPSIQHATVTIEALYQLDATDLAMPADAQFFCGLPGSSLIVEMTIPQLPPGTYAFALLRATGVDHPQQISMILANDPSGSATWKLAGLFTRPMTMGGHDGVWFWQQAREYAAKKQSWDAWFYYQTAQFLLQPVDFLTSPNLQKLRTEAEKIRPSGLPGAAPLELIADDQNYDITDIHTGEFTGHLDLIVTYRSAPNLDPVAARAQVTAIMRALLQFHPELAEAFHGLWVYASAPGNQTPFALELPMDQIQATAPPAGQHSTVTHLQGKQAS